MRRTSGIVETGGERQVDGGGGQGGVGGRAQARLQADVDGRQGGVEAGGRRSIGVGRLREDERVETQSGQAETGAVHRRSHPHGVSVVLEVRAQHLIVRRLARSDRVPARRQVALACGHVLAGAVHVQVQLVHFHLCKLATTKKRYRSVLAAAASVRPEIVA